MGRTNPNEEKDHLRKLHASCWCYAEPPPCSWRATAHVDDMQRPQLDSGFSPQLENQYEHEDDPESLRIKIHQALEQNNEHGDYTLSQGFSSIHVESTIGCSEDSRKHCSDAHNMVTLRGHKASSAVGEVAWEGQEVC